MEVASVVNGLGFESDLEAAVAHAEMHGVHVDLARIRLFLGGHSHVRILILEYRHHYLHFLASPLPYRFHQSREPWMRILS